MPFKSNNIRPIVWLASEDWDPSAAQASFHICQELSQLTQVLYCDSIGIRKPTTSRGDIVKIYSKIKRFFQGPRYVSSGLSVLTPLGLPASLGDWTSVVNSHLVITQLKRAARTLKFQLRDAIFWVSFPGWDPIVSHLRVPHKQLLLHFFDRWEAYAGVNPELILELRKHLVEKSGVVFASGHSVAEEVISYHPRVFLAPHGFHKELFLEVDRQTHSEALTVGFFGTLDSAWIDFNLLYESAKLAPHLTWMFVGRVGHLTQSDTELLVKLKSLNNVEIFGPVEFTKVPQYGKLFDVGLLPFKKTELARSASPLKLLEYLALGLPVVSSVSQQYGELGKFVRVAGNNVQDFLSQVDAALNHNGDDREQRVAAVARFGWPEMVSSYLKIAEENGIEFHR